MTTTRPVDLLRKLEDAAKALGYLQSSDPLGFANVPEPSKDLAFRLVPGFAEPRGAGRAVADESRSWDLFVLFQPIHLNHADSIRERVLPEEDRIMGALSEVDEVDSYSMQYEPSDDGRHLVLHFTIQTSYCRPVPA